MSIQTWLKSEGPNPEPQQEWWSHSDVDSLFFKQYPNNVTILSFQNIMQAADYDLINSSSINSKTNPR